MKINKNIAILERVKNTNKKSVTVSAISGIHSKKKNADVSKMNVAELNKLSVNQLKKLKPVQLNKLNSSQLNKLDLAQLKKLNPSSQAKLNQVQKSKLEAGTSPKNRDKVEISEKAQMMAKKVHLKPDVDVSKIKEKSKTDSIRQEKTTMSLLEKM